MIESESIDGHIGSRVIAEDDHQRECIAKSQRDGRGEFAENAGASHLVRTRQDEPFIQLCFAGADLLGGVEQNRQLDYGSGLDGQVGRERGGLPCLEIVRVKSNRAVVGRGNGVELRVEERIFNQGRSLRAATAKSQEKNRSKSIPADAHGLRVTQWSAGLTIEADSVSKG